MKKILKKIFALTLPAVLFAAGMANAYTYINDPANGEKNVYVIFNETFNQNLSSSDELYTLRGLPDGQDNWWELTDPNGLVKFVVRYAGYGQELGIWVNGTYQPVVTNIQSGESGNIDVGIYVDTSFAFVDKVSPSSDTTYFWYSAGTLNPIQDGVDHFFAFDVTYLYNLKYLENVKKAWLIAFEDYPGGFDFDYNDLVALVAEVQPTAIELSLFAVSPSNKKVILTWTTESEVDNAGFNLYRSESEDGEYVKVNASLIPAEGSPTQGASYQFIDEGVKNRTTYYYKLEDIDIYGKSTVHGPVNATPKRMYSIEERD
ncbi:MAG: DUF4114 domain-containing protein [Planctomycetota bacterium]|nr:DUF4114 domain-containing protein [Planctomycetota bacterium]